MARLALRGESCLGLVFPGIWRKETKRFGQGSDGLHSSRCGSARTHVAHADIVRHPVNEPCCSLTMT